MLRRLQLFFGILWHPWYGGRMRRREAWKIACIMHPNWWSK